MGRAGKDQVEKNVLLIIETTDVNLLTKVTNNYFKPIHLLRF